MNLGMQECRNMGIWECGNVGMRIMKNGAFTFQVNSYKEVILEDALINSVHQEINSKLNVVCFNVEELVLTDKNNNETNSFINNHRSYFQ